MHMSPVISPSGEPVFTVGHGHTWKQATYRGFNVSLEWVGDMRRSQPCMCIWPATNVFVSGEGNGIWVIGRRAITEFVGFNPDGTCTGGASEHCVRECKEALPILGKDPNDQQALNALMDVVIRFAPELALMPVAPKAIQMDMRGQALWEVTATDKNTGRVLSKSEV